MGEGAVRLAGHRTSRGAAATRRSAGVAGLAAEDVVAAAGVATPMEAAGAPMGAQAASTVTRVGFAPVVRLDEARREVELCATSEALDSYGTVFDYGASKDAFVRWAGNVREMHARRAVGRRVAVRCDDAARKVFVRVRISLGAADTWEKLRDGTLCGASIGASNVVWERQTRRVAGGERLVQVATRYDLVELSLVDNPSNPDALGLTLVRDALPNLDLLDQLDDAPQSGEAATAGESRARGPFSTNDEGTPDMGVPARAEERPTSALGGSPAGNARERLHTAARAILLGCDCPLCAAALAALDAAGEDLARSAADGATVTRAGEAALARVLAAGLRASVERLERMDDGMRGLRTLMQAAVSQMSGTVGDLRVRLDLLEGQPLPGGPAARAVEKGHPLHGGGVSAAGQPGAAEQYRALESLAGRLSDPQAQVAVAAEMIRLQQQRP